MALVDCLQINLCLKEIYKIRNLMDLVDKYGTMGVITKENTLEANIMDEAPILMAIAEYF